MKRFLMSLSLSAALAGAAATVAEAGGDWPQSNYGGIKDYVAVPAGVPVPAPVPVPDFAAEWYLRVDAGLGFFVENTSGSGAPFGFDNASGPPPVPFVAAVGFSPTYEAGNHGAYANAGFGVGYIWNRHLRFDLTADFNSEVSIRGFQSTRYADGVTADGRLAEATDTIKFDRQIYLVNAYYDFANRKSGFTPYVGLGLGLANTKLRRTMSAQEFTCGDPTCDPATNTLDASTAFSGSGDSRDLTFAASLMAGASYRLSEITLLDFNYRFLFVTEPDGVNVTAPNGNADAMLGVTTEHQFRAGLRFDVN